MRKVAKFLDVTITGDEVEKLFHHLSFDDMKKNPAVNKADRLVPAFNAHGLPVEHGFIRKGQIGSWKEELSPESIRKLDDWIAMNRIPGLHDEYYK